MVFRCDGAIVPRDVQTDTWDRKASITTRGGDPSLLLHAENLAGSVLQHVDDRAADLVRIAAYVYAADLDVGRGGDREENRDAWKRDLRLCIPVADPDFWSSNDIQGHLSQTLDFLTGDMWSFHFSRAKRETQQIPLDLSDVTILGQPDVVVLFSGGTDSLATAVESVQLGERPLLLSHQPALHLASWQRKLSSQLRHKIEAWSFPHLGFEIHLTGSEAKERSQRSRGFLFACLGAAVASELGIERVKLADNGIVSLNLPYTQQVVGALASRPTHPKFIERFNRLVAAVFATSIRVSNPLWNRTRAEVLSLLPEAGVVNLLHLTRSCSRLRNRSSDAPQCGYCSQCVDRRFGAAAAGLMESDPAHLYGVDIFTEIMLNGEARTNGESYYRRALDILDTPDERILDMFPELTEALSKELGGRQTVLQTYVDLLRRHAQSVVDVGTRLMHEHAEVIAQRRVLPGSLLDIIIGSTHGVDVASNPNDHSLIDHGKAWTVTFEGISRGCSATVGLTIIAYLLARPGQTFTPADLAHVG